MFVIKAHVPSRRDKRMTFEAQKTMYGGKNIAAGDTVFIFDSETEGGAGLIGLATVTAASPIARKLGVARQTPCVTVTVQVERIAKRSLGRADLKPFSTWSDARPQTELNFKLYRQATNKIIGISPETAKFLRRFF